MAFSRWINPPCRAVVQDSEARFEVEGDAEFVERSLRAYLRHHAERAGANTETAAHTRKRRVRGEKTDRVLLEAKPADVPEVQERTRRVRIPELRPPIKRERTKTELIPGRGPRRLFSEVTQPEASPAPRKAPPPTPMNDEPTMQEPGVPAVGGVHTWRKRRTSMRLHALDGGMSKVYAVSPNQLAHSRIFRHLPLNQVSNIYVEHSLLSRRMRGDNETVWHAMVPTQP